MSHHVCGTASPARRAAAVRLEIPFVLTPSLCVILFIAFALLSFFMLLLLANVFLVIVRSCFFL